MVVRHASTGCGVLHVPPTVAVSSVRFDWILKNSVEVPMSREKGRQARNVMLVVKSEKNELHDAVEKLKDRLESNGWGNGVGTGQGGLGIAGTAVDAVPAPSCWGAVVWGADVVVGVGTRSAGSVVASRTTWCLLRFQCEGERGEGAVLGSVKSVACLELRLIKTRTTTGITRPKSRWWRDGRRRGSGAHFSVVSGAGWASAAGRGLGGGVNILVRNVVERE